MYNLFHLNHHFERCCRTISNGGTIGLGGRGQPPSSSIGGKPALTSDFKCPVFLQMPHEYEYRLLIGTDQVGTFGLLNEQQA